MRRLLAGLFVTVIAAIGVAAFAAPAQALSPAQICADPNIPAGMKLLYACGG